MVKKKSSPKNTAQSRSKNVKTKKPKWFNRVLKTPHLLFKVILILAISIFVGRIGYMAIQDRFSVKLLDQAEEKIRQLDFPGGKKGVIERYCSERSVKFGSPGKPTCGVGSRVYYENTSAVTGKSYAQGFLDQIQQEGLVPILLRSDRQQQSYTISGLESKLDCTLTSSQWVNYKTNLPDETLYLYCQKSFQTKLYPVRD